MTSQPTRNYKALAVALVGLAALPGLAASTWFGWQRLLRHGPPLSVEDWRPWAAILGGLFVSLAIIFLTVRQLDRMGVRPPE